MIPIKRTHVKIFLMLWIKIDFFWVMLLHTGIPLCKKNQNVLERDNFLYTSIMRCICDGYQEFLYLKSSKRVHLAILDTECIVYVVKDLKKIMFGESPKQSFSTRKAVQNYSITHSIKFENLRFNPCLWISINMTRNIWFYLEWYF